MPDPDRDPVELDDVGPTRLCIVSHDPLLCGPFVAALQTVLSPHDEFEIIQDRRRDTSSTELKRDVADQPSVDRRRHPVSVANADPRSSTVDGSGTDAAAAVVYVPCRSSAAVKSVKNHSALGVCVIARSNE